MHLRKVNFVLFFCSLFSLETSDYRFWVLFLMLVVTSFLFGSACRTESTFVYWNVCPGLNERRERLPKHSDGDPQDSVRKGDARQSSRSSARCRRPRNTLHNPTNWCGRSKEELLLKWCSTFFTAYKERLTRFGVSIQPWKICGAGWSPFRRFFPGRYSFYLHVTFQCVMLSSCPPLLSCLIFGIFSHRC